MPAFFVSIGAKTNLTVLNPANPANLEGLIIAVFLIVVAIVGKVTAGFLVSSSSPLNRVAIGMGMVPRGEVGLVFVGLDSATDALPESIEAGIVLMVIATTLLAPILLLATFQTTASEPTSEERSRAYKSNAQR